MLAVAAVIAVVLTLVALIHPVREATTQQKHIAVQAAIPTITTLHQMFVAMGSTFKVICELTAIKPAPIISQKLVT